MTTGTTAGQGIDISVVNDLNLLTGGQINSLSPAGRGASGNISISAESIRLDGGGLVNQSGDPTTQSYQPRRASSLLEVELPRVVTS